MPETKDSARRLIAKQLKLNPLTQIATINAILALFEKRVENNDYSKVNTELRALDYLKEQAIAIAQQTYPLVCDANGNPKFSISCDPYTFALKLELTIDPNSDHRLKGRSININLMHRSANNNFSPQDIQKILESKIEAALSFAPDNKLFREKVLFFAGDFKANGANALPGTIAADFKAIAAKFSTYTAAVAAGDKELASVYIESIIDLCDQMLTSLAIELVRLQKLKLKNPGHSYNPNRSQIQAAKAQIKQREIELISSKTRPVIIKAYFQEYSDPDIIQAIVNVPEPITDVSSDLRTFPNDQLSNYWQTTNYSIQFRETKVATTHTFIPTRAPIIDSFYRSASIAELIDILPDDEFKIETSKLETSQEYLQDISSVESVDISGKELVRREIEVLKKAMLNVAKQQLIKQLLAATDQEAIDKILNNDFYVKIAFLTLLTPILDRESALALYRLPGSRVLSGLSNTLLRGNELEQLMSMMVSFSQIESIELNFSTSDMHDIERALESKPEVTAKLQSIQSLTIKPRVSFLNLPVNQDPITGRSGEALDFTKFNPVYNAAGMKLLIRNIEQYIDENYPVSNKANSIHLTLRNLFAQALNSDKEDWKALQELLIQRSNLFDNNIKQIVLHFININTHIKVLSVSNNKNSRNADAYMVATANIYILNRLLGFDMHVTCKSGKDRTGLFSLLREALIDANNNEKLIDNICNALKYSSAKDMNELNVPGGRGLQIDEDILDGLTELFGKKFQGQERIEAILREQQTRRISGIPRKVYNRKTATEAWLKNNPPTEPEPTVSQRFKNAASQKAQSSFRVAEKSSRLLVEKSSKLLANNPFVMRDRAAKDVADREKQPSPITYTRPTETSQPLAAKGDEPQAARTRLRNPLIVELEALLEAKGISSPNSKGPN